MPDDKLYMVYVHLAPDEWGYEKMRAVAEECLRAKRCARLDPLVVEVW